MNHYPRHVGDIITATIGLTLAERGAYTALLDQYYAREKPLPLNRDECYRLAAAVTDDEKKAVDYVLKRYFTAEADGFNNARCNHELQLYQERSASASASAQARWNKGNATAMRPHSVGIANHKPVTSNQEPLTTKPKAPARKRATPMPADFAISERVKTWAASKGHGKLDQHLEAFVGKVRAKGYTYIDWDDALMNCIREDWGKVNSAKPVLSAVPTHASHVPVKAPGLEVLLAHTEMPDTARAALDAFKAKVRA